MGGVGSWVVVVVVGVEGASVGPISAWRERHVLMILPKAVCVESVGGEAGGEATRDAWRRVVGRGGSHWSADGNNIVSMVQFGSANIRESDSRGVSGLW